MTSPTARAGPAFEFVPETLAFAGAADAEVSDFLGQFAAGGAGSNNNKSPASYLRLLNPEKVHAVRAFDAASGGRAGLGRVVALFAVDGLRRNLIHYRVINFNIKFRVTGASF